MDRKNSKTIYISALAILLIFGMSLYAVWAQKSIAGKVIRLHVVANSDSKEDQALKLRVRDEILAFMGEKMFSAKTKGEAEKIIESSMTEIKDISEILIKSEGFGYEARVSMTQEDFPMKNYGSFSFPAGNYTALKVKIGDAKGKNWWCIVFPPLCSTEETVYEEGERILRETFSERDMEIVCRGEENPKARVKFFIVEKWQEIFNLL